MAKTLKDKRMTISVRLDDFDFIKEYAATRWQGNLSMALREAIQVLKAANQRP